jgi:hypothetical protein
VLDLKKIDPGLYRVVGAPIGVRKETGRTWNARDGSVAYTRWVAYGTEPPFVSVAQARTFVDVKKRLLRYLEDLEGALGPRSRYGFTLDTRPAERVVTGASAHPYAPTPVRNPRAAPKPTAEQARVLRLLSESGDTTVQYRKGGFWTAPSVGVSHQNMGVDVPFWYTAPGTLKAMERHGWLIRDGTKWDAPIVLTPEGQRVTERV